jgi:hypothetical protein
VGWEGGVGGGAAGGRWSRGATLEVDEERGR